MAAKAHFAESSQRILDAERGSQCTLEAWQPKFTGTCNGRKVFQYPRHLRRCSTPDSLTLTRYTQTHTQWQLPPSECISHTTRTHARTHALVSARARTHTHTHTSRTRYFCFGAISILAIEVTSSLIFIGRRSASFFFVVMKALCPHKDTDAPSRNDTDALTNPQMNVRGFQAAFKHTTRTRLRI